ncbi:MAG: DUF839 domain-containing protein [Chloroflexi bacterium]|nr:DUF839 domain-containing protein [Chloroflexota bacterium]
MTSRLSGGARRRTVATALLIGTAVTGITPLAAAAQVTGPSTTRAPYYLPSAAGVETTSILTVGESIGGYKLIGIPDGTGAYTNDDGTFSWLVNHEIPETFPGPGVARDHGAAGAFVSQWTINDDPNDLQVVEGDDLIKRVATWNTATDSHNALARGVPIYRLCSADLPELSAFYNRNSKLGYNGRIYLNGEEVGDEGRAFGHLLNGNSYELPALGKFSWENAVANPATRNRTVVIGLDDSTPGQVYVYVGKKSNKGNPVERAGLTDGNLYGVKVAGVTDESRATGIGGTSKPFSLHNFSNVSDWSGAQLQASSESAGVTQFLRPEDGAWDPNNPNDFYFVTTDRFDPNKAVNDSADGRSRLWRLSFENAKDPAAGGTITMLLDGTEPHQMLDNLTIDDYGHILIQEDPGNQAYLAKIWQYTIASDGLKLIAEANADYFTNQAGDDGDFITTDEESSGIIDASHVLGAGWFLFDVQAHKRLGGELVEDGQLLALYNPDTAAAAGQ